MRTWLWGITYKHGLEVRFFGIFSRQQTRWSVSECHSPQTTFRINSDLQSCAFHPGAFPYGDHVACYAVHGTSVAKKSESTLPST